MVKDFFLHGGGREGKSKGHWSGPCHSAVVWAEEPGVVKTPSGLELGRGSPLGLVPLCGLSWTSFCARAKVFVLWALGMVASSHF
jgi:hypothetical protein